MRPVCETNVFGTVRVTHTFLSLTAGRPTRSVINVTSGGVGSFMLVHDPNRVESQYPLAAYGSSKVAVTTLTMQYARTLPDVRLNVVDPGAVRDRPRRRASLVKRHPQGITKTSPLM